MIPVGDHSSRTLLLRRVSSWSEVATTASNDNINYDNGEDGDGGDGHGHGPHTTSRQDGGGRGNDDDGDENDDQASLLSSFDDSSFLSSPQTNSLAALLPNLEYEEASAASSSTVRGDGGGDHTILNRLLRINWKLWSVFVLLVLSGVGNVLLAKMSSYRLYPTFLNMYSNVMYTILSFAYIIPVGRFGWFRRSIPRAHWTSLPKRPFAIMGCLDAMSATIQVLANVYLPGTLLVLIPQAAIPLSMLGSAIVLRERYSVHQYVGAVVVLTGILLVLFPVFTHQREADYYCRAIDEENDCTLCQIETTENGCLSHIKTDDDGGGGGGYDPMMMMQFQRGFILQNSHKNHSSDHDHDTGLYCTWVSRDQAIKEDDFLVFVWSILMLLSLVPMVMSTIYKQVALQVHLDPILVNGWVSVFQFIFGMALVVPAGLLSSPRVHPFEIGSNWESGLQCLFTQTNTVEVGCHPDDCGQAALWVHLGLISAIVYALSMMFVLKYGTCDLMYLGLTLVVPLAHLAFAFNAMADVSVFDICGLLVSVTGLFMYRFGHEDPSSSSPDVITTRDDVHGDYQPLASGENDVDGMEDMGGVVPQEPFQESFQGNTVDGANDKGGFLEFLREPFLLVGDI
jgi:CRT-like, chloroquine-resistance transporter-like